MAFATHWRGCGSLVAINKDAFRQLSGRGGEHLHSNRLVVEMSQCFAFELVFKIPVDSWDALALSDGVFSAGFSDAVVGTGTHGLLSVELEVSGPTARETILKSARSVLGKLPSGSKLRCIGPDLVSLADVAQRLGITRQSLQKRKMPPPFCGRVYRISEIENALRLSSEEYCGGRKARFDLESQSGWFEAGQEASRLNAELVLGILDPDRP